MFLIRGLVFSYEALIYVRWSEGIGFNRDA
jgi:hypothetical protein